MHCPNGLEKSDVWEADVPACPANLRDTDADVNAQLVLNPRLLYSNSGCSEAHQILAVMPTKVLFLAGAPESDTLDWDNTPLHNDFISQIARFLGIASLESGLQPSDPPVGSSRLAAWRTLTLTRQYLTTGHSQRQAFESEYRGSADFFAIADISSINEASATHETVNDKSQSSSTESTEEILSQFYEHSFALHVNIASSQIRVPLSVPEHSVSESGHVVMSNSAGTSFVSETSNAFSESFISTPPKIPVPCSGHLSDLEDIPNASYLHMIQPQTMSVNLIVGIISISTPRNIRTRRGADVEIVELLVADETKSGFGINFWLNYTSKQNSSLALGDNLRSSLSNFRPQDIILVRNLALSTFRGKVYGQSLRKEMTKVHLLYRNRIDRKDMGGCYSLADFGLHGGNGKMLHLHPQLEKTRRVREWVLKFVGAVNFRKFEEGRGLEIINEVLPPDTQ